MNNEKLEEQTIEAIRAWRKDNEIKLEASTDGGKTWCKPFALGSYPCTSNRWNWRLPKPKVKKRVALTRDDWRGVWFVTGVMCENWRLVVEVGISRIVLHNFEFTHKQMMEEHYQRSRDCITWEPCYKEIEVEE